MIKMIATQAVCALLLFVSWSTYSADKEAKGQFFEPANEQQCIELFRKQAWTRKVVVQALLSVYLDVVDELLDQRNNQVDSSKENGNNSQQEAIKLVHEDVITILKNKDIQLKLRNTKGTEDILVFRKNLDAVTLLSKNKYLKIFIDNTANNSFLHFAAANGCLDLVKRLVRLLPEEIDARNALGKTSLHLAAQNGQLNTLQFLLTAGANKNARDKNGNSILHDATHCNQLVVVQFSVTQNVVSINSKNIAGQTPLHLAAIYGQLTTLQFLLTAGANKDAQDHNGNTVLHTAAANGHAAFLGYFLKNYRFDINRVNNHNGTPLDCALNYERTLEAVVCLLQFGAQYDQNHIERIEQHDDFENAIWNLLPHIFSQTEEKQLLWRSMFDKRASRKINTTPNWETTSEGRAYSLIKLLPEMNQQSIPYFKEARALLSQKFPQDLVRELCEFTAIPWRNVDKESHDNKRSHHDDEDVASPASTKKQRVE